MLDSKNENYLTIKRNLIINKLEMESKMKPILKEIADYYLEQDCENEVWEIPSFYIDYSDEEVVDATMIFAHVVGNRFKKLPDCTVEKAKEFWAAIHKMVETYARLDTKEFYK